MLQNEKKKKKQKKELTFSSLNDMTMMNESHGLCVKMIIMISVVTVRSDQSTYICKVANLVDLKTTSNFVCFTRHGPSSSFRLTGHIGENFIIYLLHIYIDSTWGLL